MSEKTTLLHLWQQHKLHVKLTTSLTGIESLTIWATICKEEEAEELLAFFNQLAGTEYTRADLAEAKRIDQVCDGKTLQLREKTLWPLDMEDATYPLYALSEDEAEYLAGILERSTRKERRSLRRSPHGTGKYPGSLLVLSITTERVSRPLI